jgi:hypothetical protein
MKAHDSFAPRLAALLLFVAALSRVLPHPPNFAPLIAIALFGGATLPRAGWAALATFGALVVSDFALGLFPYDGMLWVYGAMLAILVVGRALRARQSAGSIAIATLGSGLLFFVVTNFGVWLTGHLYPRTLAGLAACYTMALPFYGNQIAADFTYAGVLFGLHAAIVRARAAREEQA